MSKTQFIRPNSLGDLKAEADQEMLNRAFLETADYRTLIETSDRTVVVGRRGTGKSALTLQLERYWGNSSHTTVIKITPEEHQTIGLRPKVALFGDSFNKVRAGSRLVWRYALMMEVALCLSKKHKFSNTAGYRSIESSVKKWSSRGRNILDRYAETLNEVVDNKLSPEARIGELPKSLNLTEIESDLLNACSNSKEEVVFLIDRLDEGYEPDDNGVGLIDGLIQAAIDLKTRIPKIKPVIFLRDNIFRAVQSLDPDYSRNIEGYVLRLHWDAESLLTFAANRLKIAFAITHQASQRIWNSCTSRELKGREGFNRCLQLTLYRPRDLLSLLNEAFYLAGKNGQLEIILSHIESTGHLISKNRLDDLRKEYAAILPGLNNLTAGFYGKNPEMTVEDASKLFKSVLDKGSEDSIIRQNFFILNDGDAALRTLYSIGFIGIRDGAAGTFVFCHDGRAPDRDFSAPDRILVHPCYWMALNCTRSTLNYEEAEDIYDEYDIEVSSETPEIRNAKIKELIAQLDNINEGTSGSTDFELWCHKAIRICFAKGLRNVELKPNKLAKSRRDIVATNLGDGDAWRRIYEDYKTRQVIFEVKNYQDLKATDYQQIQSYLTGGYGCLAFVVTRGSSVDLYAGKDVEWVRELYNNHKVLVIKLTGKFFCNLLLKLRRPQKHDAVNNSINRLLDTYTRLYIAGQTRPQRTQKKRRKHKKSTLTTGCDMDGNPPINNQYYK